MALAEDFVYETANNPGTGTVNLAGTVTGRRTWASVFASGTQVYYGITDGASWEEGYGVFTTGSPNTLARTAVLDNSLNTTAKINFTGSVQVYCVLPMRRQVAVNPANDALLVGSRRVSGLVAGAAVDDAPRLDQVAYQNISSVSISSSTGAAIFTLPAGFLRFWLEWEFCVPVAAAACYVRFSTDGGSTYLSGGSDYNSHSVVANTGSTTPYSSGSLASYLPLSETQSASFACRGVLDFSNVGQAQSRFFGINSSSQLSQAWMGGYSNNTTKTNVLLGFVGQNIAQGAFRLSGRL